MKDYVLSSFSGPLFYLNLLFSAPTLSAVSSCSAEPLFLLILLLVVLLLLPVLLLLLLLLLFLFQQLCHALPLLLEHEPVNDPP